MNQAGAQRTRRPGGPARDAPTWRLARVSLPALAARLPGSRLRRPSGAGRQGVPGWLVAGVVYLAGSLALWWHVWTAEPTSTMTCGCGDPASFVWFLAWPKYALTHGQDLFLATRAHVPQGTNLLDNTSVLALGVVLLPVTAAFGPVMALNVALTAAPAASALSAYGCLRRGLGVSRAAAFVGGLAFGFSPFMLRNEAVGHLQVSFLALVPPMLWCVYELAVAQRGRWWRWGLGLGLLAVVQFFIGTEVLTITALLTGLGLLLAGAATVIWRREALRQPGVVRAWAGFAARGFGLAAAVAGACLAYPLWFALAGPQHIHGADWTSATSNSLLRVIFPFSPPVGQVGTLPMTGYLGHSGLPSGYIGIFALVLLAVAVAVVRRPLVTLCAVLALAGLWLSLGASTIPLAKDGEPSWLWLPFSALGKLPMLNKISPANFSALAVLFTAVAVALLVDRLPAVMAGRLPAAAAVTVAAAALVLPWLLSWPLPFSTQTVTTPAWVRHEAAGLPAHAVVLFYPFPASYQDRALIWQADQGMRYSVAGGRGIVAGPDGSADHGFTPGTPDGTLSALTTSYTPRAYRPLPKPPDRATIAAMRAALRSWGVTEVVMTPGGRDPGYARRWLTAVLGRPPQRQDGAWVWSNVRGS